MPDFITLKSSFPYPASKMRKATKKKGVLYTDIEVGPVDSA